MSKSYIKVNGSWKELFSPYINQNGTWRPIKKIWVKDSGVWRQVFGNTGTVTFSLGSTTFIVPPGVYSLSVTGCGGGGAGGSGDGGKNDEGPGYGGGGSNLITQSYSVLPGTVLNITVGRGGLGSRNTGVGLLGGGEAGRPTTITGGSVNFNAVGGGGGGGHPGWGGQGEISPGVVGNTVGGQGANGANAGGYPNGGTSTNGGATGGRGGNHDMQPGLNGQDGKLTITY
jgi:hypothetical protein